MTDALSPTVPAGWYPDPWGSSSRRWWDGSAWTGSLTAAEPTLQDASGQHAPPPQFEQSEDATPDEHHEPASVPSPHTPAPGAADAVPTAEPAFPSRRALRQQASAEVGSATLTVEPLPAFTQVPEFTPEPVSALPPPVWTEPDPPAMAEPAAPAATPSAAAASPAPTSSAAAAPADAEPAAPAAIAIAEPAEFVAPAAVAAPPAVVGQAAPVPTTTSEEEDDDGWAASLASWDDVDTTSTDPPDARPIFGDSRPVSYSQRAVRYQPLHARTSPVWLIVFMPLLHGVALVGSVFLFPAALAALESFRPERASLEALSEWLLFAAAPLGVAFFLFTLIMGFQDRARLRLLGHEDTASPWWIVLHPLIYLIVRSIRVRQCTGRRGSGPLTTYLCFYVAPPIALGVATAVITALDGAIPV